MIINTKGLDAPLDFPFVAHVDGSHFQALRWGHSLNNGELTNPGRYCGIPKNCRSRDTRCDLLEQVRPFSTQTGFEQHKAGHVTTGPRQTLDEAGTNRIDNDCEYNWHCTGCPDQRRHGRVADSQNNVGPERNQFCRIFPHGGATACAATNVDLDVAALSPAKSLKLLRERSDAEFGLRVVPGDAREHADAPHTLALLRARGERPRCCRAAEEGDELAPLHIRPQVQETALYRLSRAL